MPTLSLALTAAGAYATTNVDGAVVLTALFASQRRGGPDRRAIVVGQFVGMTVLFAVSALLAGTLLALPDRWIGLLGLIPIVLGLRGLVSSARGPQDGSTPTPTLVSGALGVSLLTIANGADNLSIVTPLLRHDLGVLALLTYLTTFALMVTVWLIAARLIAGHTRVQQFVAVTGSWLVPVVLVCVGISILMSAGLAGGAAIPA